jgi:hypothetical protein
MFETIATVWTIGKQIYDGASFIFNPGRPFFEPRTAAEITSSLRSIAKSLDQLANPAMPTSEGVAAQRLSESSVAPGAAMSPDAATEGWPAPHGGDPGAGHLSVQLLAAIGEGLHRWALGLPCDKPKYWESIAAAANRASHDVAFARSAADLRK